MSRKEQEDMEYQDLLSRVDNMILEENKENYYYDILTLYLNKLIAFGYYIFEATKAILTLLLACILEINSSIYTYFFTDSSPSIITPESN